MQLQDVRLVVTIENKMPVELIDLAKSLFALSDQFTDYVSANAQNRNERAARLYVKEIKSGSVIVELVEYATIGMIPFLENVNTIVGFGQYLKNAVDFFLNGTGENPNLETGDYRDLSTIINPIAKDNGSQLNIQTIVNGNVTVNLNVTSLESNALQNVFKKEIESKKEPEVLPDAIEKVLMTLFQARSDKNATTGNKGTIESLDKKPLNLIFATDDLKNDILHGSDNPLHNAFIVDVKIQNANGKPAAYTILKLHESFEITD